NNNIKTSCNTTMNHVSVNDCIDPTTIIWTRTDNSPSSLADFNLGGTNPSYLPNCDLSGVGNDCLSTSPVVSNTSIAISHDTIGDLGIANGKSLLFHVGWIASNNVTLGTWGFFLTKNNTAPNHAIGSSAQYDQFNDPN